MTNKTETERTSVEATRNGVADTPPTDIYEQDDAVVVVADMPGVEQSRVEVTLEDNVLTLYGRRTGGEPAGKELLHQEFLVRDYRRSFTLTEDVDRDKIRATMKDGVLRVVLPKAAEKQPRTIRVEAG